MQSIFKFLVKICCRIYFLKGNYFLGLCSQMRYSFLFLLKIILQGLPPLLFYLQICLQLKPRTGKTKQKPLCTTVPLMKTKQSLLLGAIEYYHNKLLTYMFSKAEIMCQYNDILGISVINKALSLRKCFSKYVYLKDQEYGIILKS